MVARTSLHFYQKGRLFLTKNKDFAMKFLNDKRNEKSLKLHYLVYFEPINPNLESISMEEQCLQSYEK